MRAALALVVLLAPLALAQEPPAQPASFLVYRPWPEARDELATALAPPPFDAARLPATRIDRTSVASSAPENRPESAPAHYREMLRLVQRAEAEGAPVALTMDGGLVGPAALEVRVSSGHGPVIEASPAQVRLSLVVFEHGVVVAGRPHPYVARFALDPFDLAVPGDATTEVRLDASWEIDRLGVVAIAHNETGVLQSATWLVRQELPSQQIAKAPLVEHVTASWCTPCTAADEALLLLATQRGAAGPLGGDGHAGYLRAPSGWLWAGAALGAVAAIALVGRRRA